MMRIAIIGGIGSGKSEVLKVARERGLDCASADEINSALLKDESYIKKIDEAFNGVVEKGTINRAKLAQIVFNDEHELKRLNDIAHPEIMRRIYDNNSDIYVVEMPLILESNAVEYFDKILLVYTPIIKRLRLLKKRGLGYTDAIKRIRTQHSTKELKRIATHVICNDSSIDALRCKANNVLDEIAK